MSVMAFAALAMTMISCNKEEAYVGTNFNVSFEDSEVMNQVKTYFDGHNQYFEEGDEFYIMDGSGNIALYTIDPNANPNYIFTNAIRGSFDPENGVLTAFYPRTIVHNNNPNEVQLSGYQKTRNGEIQWPLYAQGELQDFQFRNLCGNHSIYLSGNVALDSITITTDQYMSGNFKVDISNLTNPLKYGTGSGTSRITAMGHGTRTSSLNFRRPFQLTNTEQLVRITVPAGTYQNYIITFYANGKKLVKSNVRPIQIGRTTFNESHITLNATEFVDFTKGALNAQYNVGTSATPRYVVFSQGNLEYICLQNQIWRFAENQWDFRGTSQKTIQNQYDRDLFAWGANGYYKGSNLLGNRIKVWGEGSGSNARFRFLENENTLSGANEWGNNRIANGGNSEDGDGWRTLTYEEMTNLLANYASAMVTLDFNGKTGLVIFAEGVTPVADGTTLTKSEWNTLQNAGCVFFLAGGHRAADRTMANGSYYWLNDASSNNKAFALFVNNNGATLADEGVDRGIGAFVRLVKDVQ